MSARALADAAAAASTRLPIGYGRATATETAVGATHGVPSALRIPSWILVPRTSGGCALSFA